MGSTQMSGQAAPEDVIGPLPDQVGGDDTVLKEWSECRATIGRLDQVLEDLRKFGFTLITTLLAAGSFIGYGSGHPSAGVGAFIAVMCLIGALFGVDLYYAVMQSGAVERALDLEVSQSLQVTRYISHHAIKARSEQVILVFYLFLLVIAGALGVASAVASGSFSMAFVLLTVLIGVSLLAGMLGYWVYVARLTGLHAVARDRPWRGPFPPVTRHKPSHRA